MGERSEFEVEFKYKKSTKNTHVYESDGEITSLYIEKEALPQPAPEKVTVRVSW